MCSFGGSTKQKRPGLNMVDRFFSLRARLLHAQSCLTMTSAQTNLNGENLSILGMVLDLFLSSLQWLTLTEFPALSDSQVHSVMR